MTADAAEFRSVDRNISPEIIDSLMAITVVYGVCLTLTLPLAVIGVLDASSSDSFAVQFLQAVFAANFIATMCRWCTVHPLAFCGFRDLRTPATVTKRQPFVSILVPAFNEDETMAAALVSLTAQNYPDYEIIVIDDGSRDRTYEISKQFEGRHLRCTVQVVTKPNGGKWSALNKGFELARGNLILCVDADTRLASDTLSVCVARLLADDRNGGLAGQVTIRNRFSVLMRMQALEYVLGNGGMRMAMSVGGIVTIVPGAIGLYRRSVLEEVAALNRRIEPPPSHPAPGAVYGPLSGDTFAEDFQLSLSVLALGHRIIYEPRSVAFTKGPTRIDTLLSQRYRWMRGTWQVIAIYLKHLHKIAAQKRPLLPWVVGACYSIDIYLMPLLNFGFWAWLAIMFAAGFDIGPIALILGAVALLNVMTGAIYILEQRDDLRLLPFAALMDLYLSYVVNSAWLIAAIDELRGGKMRWH